MSADFAVVHQLNNRRLYRASGRVLDAVHDELAELRARTGEGSATALVEITGFDFEAASAELTEAAAYQASMRTATTIRQRSLMEFLK
jgi:hypothetical protein